jgi:hypothetical protein
MDQSFMPDEPEVPKRNGKKTRKPKPYIVWAWFDLFGHWYKHGAYETEEVANDVVRQMNRKYPNQHYVMGPKPKRNLK